MFKLQLAEGDLLKDSISIISEILDEANLVVDKTGVSLLAPDRTMVSVVDFKLLPLAFDDFQVKDAVTVGLNLSNFASILKRAKSGDKISLEYADGKLIVRVKGGSTRTFDLPAIDVKTEKPPIDQLKFNTKVEIESGVLEEGIQDAEIVSDAVFLEAQPDIFRMHAKGDVSKAELEIRKGEEGLLSINTAEKVRAQYPLDYLKKMIKASRFADQVVLEFGKDYPLKLDFRVLDKMQMMFILAPRVSED